MLRDGTSPEKGRSFCGWDRDNLSLAEYEGMIRHWRLLYERIPVIDCSSVPDMNVSHRSFPSRTPIAATKIFLGTHFGKYIYVLLSRNRAITSEPPSGCWKHEFTRVNKSKENTYEKP